MNGHWNAKENRIPWTEEIPGRVSDILIRIPVYQDNLKKIIFPGVFQDSHNFARTFMWEPCVREEYDRNTVQTTENITLDE